MGDDAGRWREHPCLAASVRVLVAVAPFLVSIAIGLGVGRVLPGRGSALWWVAVFVVSTAALRVIDRLARRLLPLAVLLDLALLFPEQAPSRFRTALKAGSAKHVEGTHGAETVVALLASLSAHHRPSRRHSERVRAYTELIAEELRLPEGDRQRLRWAALLHDIGKVDVPVRVLEGTGPLSEAGWKVIHRHPLDGARLVEPLREWLGPWAASVEQHHERIDGTGYPHGLTGEEICLGARIVAVADSFEAMTARRSYQEPMSMERARVRLTELSGSQLDPMVVRAFLAVSVNQLRWAYGPLAWVAEAPALAGIARMPGAAAVGAKAGAAAAGAALAVAVTGGPVPEARVAAVTMSRTVRAAAV
ncbi:MAG TPA: HD-GYP domain-containing protein, partial [Acidimicrobiales bacterium]|nr:HD-GYP domain-containing protein [Acidimicrobiales bacterium]